MSPSSIDLTSPGSHAGDWQFLLDAIERLSLARRIEEVIGVVRDTARAVAGADGACFVLREGDLCHYIEEDAIGPLWKGRKFPMDACISGWVMLNRATAVVPNIYGDARIPHDAYRPTFVQSLVMVPVRHEDPLGAIGVYWTFRHAPGEDRVQRMEALARATATALENVGLYGALQVELDRARSHAAEMQRLADEVQRAEEALRSVNKRMHEVQDTERRRIARDLHDSTAQHLVGAAIGITRALGSDAKLAYSARAALEESAGLVEQRNRSRSKAPHSLRRSISCASRACSRRTRHRTTQSPGEKGRMAVA